MSKSVIIAAAIILSSASIPASATLETEEVRMNVQYGDLDLSNKAGQATLYKRLQRAAKNVCDYGAIGHNKPLRETMQSRACYQETLSSAVEHFNHAGLRQLHDS